MRSDKYTNGPLLVLFASFAAPAIVVGVKLLGLMDGSDETFFTLAAWVVGIFGVFYSAVAATIGILKRRAARVGQVIHSQALLVMTDITGGLGQLRTPEGFGGPLYPVVSARAGTLEFWNGVDKGEPYAAIPLAMTRTTIGRQWNPWPHAALFVSVAGLSQPLALSVYGEQWWSVLPMNAQALEAAGENLGLIVPPAIQVSDENSSHEA